MLLLSSFLLLVTRGVAAAGAHKQCVRDAIGKNAQDILSACNTVAQLEQCEAALEAAGMQLTYAQLTNLLTCGGGGGGGGSATWADRVMPVIARFDGEVYAAAVQPPGNFEELRDEIVHASGDHTGWEVVLKFESEFGTISITDDSSLAGALALALDAEGSSNALVLDLVRVTASPTKAPTELPTASPTKLPTQSPSPEPTPSPTPSPSAAPKVFGPNHVFNWRTSDFYISTGQGGCSVGTAQQDAEYFCTHFYGGRNGNCVPTSWTEATSSQANYSSWQLHKRGGCNTNGGEDIEGLTCAGGPCKIWNTSANHHGLTNLVCKCS